MTTEIIVNAHCGKDKEVEVKVIEEGETAETNILQDGETMIRYAFDDREISVKEIEKKE
jgi:hypothetical protein